MSLCFWFCICHFYCLFSVLSFTELFIDHSIKDFVLFRRSKARQKRSNHKYFGASKTNRVCWGFCFNFLTLTVGDRQIYFKIMQFKKIYKTETRNVVYLVILQIYCLIYWIILFITNIKYHENMWIYSEQLTFSMYKPLGWSGRLLTGRRVSHICGVLDSA